MSCIIYWTAVYARKDQTSIFGQSTHNFVGTYIIRIFLYLCEKKTYDKTAPMTYLILSKTMKECKRYLSQLFLTISPYCPFNEVLKVVPRDRCSFDFNLHRQLVIQYSNFDDFGTHFIHILPVAHPLSR